MDVFFWAIDPRVAFWTRFEANFRLGRNQGPLFLDGLASPRVPGQLQFLAWLNCIRATSGRGIFELFSNDAADCCLSFLPSVAMVFTLGADRAGDDLMTMSYVEKIGPSFVVEANIGPRLSRHGSKWPIHRLFICQDR